MPLHMWVPWHPELPPQTASPWWSRVMSKRATAQSAASSLAHIYKPDPVAAHCVKPPRLAEPRAWQELKERVDEVWKSYRARSKPASNNEQQIAMGTRSFLLLPPRTNSGGAGGIQSMAEHMWVYVSPPSHSPLLFSNFNNSCCFFNYTYTVWQGYMFM